MKKQILMVSLFILSCALIAASVWAAGKGGGKGGFGETGAACATFGDAPGDEIISDGKTPHAGNPDGIDPRAYCNGTDGQVSVPKRFRIDLKKFNSYERSIKVDLLVLPLFDGNVIFQSQLQYDAAGNPTQMELDFPSMTNGSTASVSMSVDFSVGRRDAFRITYGTDGDERLSCPSGSAAQPVEVTCTDFLDGQCVRWTVTGSSACLSNTKDGSLLGDVTADFSLDVVVSPFQ